MNPKTRNPYSLPWQYLPKYDDLWAFPDADVRQQELQKMMRTQVQQCTDGFMCLMCGKIVKRANHMRRHIKEQHMQAEYFRCPPCDRVFVNRQFYNHIQKTHPTWKDIDYDRYRVQDV